MILVGADAVPNTVSKIGQEARDLGWSVVYTYASPPYRPSVALRVFRGRRRAFAVWHLDSATGGARFAGAAGNVIPGGHLPTLASFRTFLVAPPYDGEP